MRILISSNRFDASAPVSAINLGSHFLRGTQQIPVSKLQLGRRVRGLTAFNHIGSRTSESCKVRGLHQLLGIDARYRERHQLEQQAEAAVLSLCAMDGLGREFWLAPAASFAWRALKSAALSDQAMLVEISGFRSVEAQAALILRKLRRSQTIEQILRVSAAPGFSEHHTGRAIDFADVSELNDKKFLTEAFEMTKSYQWLVQNARRFGFTQSYARDNRHGIAYEPWHWLYRPGF